MLTTLVLSVCVQCIQGLLRNKFIFSLHPERGCGAAVMYSPQSLHRWGITHSESMERLAYSQGKLLELHILS